MPSFTYDGPPDEPGIDGTENVLTGAWVKGVAREIVDAGHVAWLRRHPHWSEVLIEPADTDTDGEITVAEARARLDALGIDYDRRWGLAKLRAALAQVGE